MKLKSSQTLKRSVKLKMKDYNLKIEGKSESSELKNEL